MHSSWLSSQGCLLCWIPHEELAQPLLAPKEVTVARWPRLLHLPPVSWNSACALDRRESRGLCLLHGGPQLRRAQMLPASFAQVAVDILAVLVPATLEVDRRVDTGLLVRRRWRRRLPRRELRRILYDLGILQLVLCGALRSCWLRGPGRRRRARWTLWLQQPSQGIWQPSFYAAESLDERCEVEQLVAEDPPTL